MTQKLDFFISYNQADRNWARGLALALRSRGAATFLDEDSIRVGEDLVTSVECALLSSRFVILLMSPNSANSQWVKLEWASLLHEDPNNAAGRLLPVLIADCEIPLLLRRFKHLNSKAESPAWCASRLLELPDLDSAPKGSEREQKPLSRLSIQTTAPLPFGAPEYIERADDVLVRQYLGTGQSLYVYGPRMSGKTSMLVRALDYARLSGMKTCFIDFQMMGAASPNQFFSALAYEISSEFEIAWQQSDLPHIQLRRVLDEAADRAAPSRLVLAFDEFDLLHSRAETQSFLSMFRVLTGPLFPNIVCICAGVIPYWEWMDSGVESPWWNSVHPVHISKFSLEQIGELFELLGAYTETELLEIERLTGGHAALVTRAAHQVAEGLSLSQVFEDSTKITGPFMPIVQCLIGCMNYLLGDRAKDVLKQLRRGRRIRNVRDRKLLWIGGITADPESDPPRIAASLIKQALDM